MTEEDNAKNSSADTATKTDANYPVCSKCGFDDVVKDAWASWNPETKLWELKDIFDDNFCLNCEETTTLDWKPQSETKNANIRWLNDELRVGKLVNGQTVITPGIQALDEPIVKEIVRAIADFNKFTPDNDPHEEHDFGSLEVDGEKIFFKIDYFDLEMKMHSPDPSDPSVTKRVLTIMLASEY